MGKNTKKTSLKTRLLAAFFVTSIIPIVIVNLFSYFNSSRIVRSHMQELIRANLQQTRSSLDVWLESYEDILLQIYTDDDIVNLVDNINSGKDVSVSKNQLRRVLHGLFYTKEYIKSISIITENGTLIFYDLITGSSTDNSWIGYMDMTEEELYSSVIEDNHTHFISTQSGIPFGSKEYYLFHIGHRIIDYRDVDKQLGIVVVSVDEELLDSVCSNEENLDSSFNFMVDEEGKIVSYPDKKKLTMQAITWSGNEEERKAGYEEFIRGQDISNGKTMSVDVVYDEVFHCDIINVSSQEEVIRRLNAQQQITLIVIGISLGALAVMILILIQRLTGSLNNMVTVMKCAGKGELSARVKIEKNMPGEVETIAQEFNYMLEKLSVSMEHEREALDRQRKAEIAALEAQINPHFLYNTLDTINWMAIDREEYEISSAINSLAYILRYGIDDSNGIVTVRQECDWLKKYLFLQQTRLKNTFQCEIHIEPEVMEMHIHKLLLQPFVENAILHGFDGVNRVHILSVDISREQEKLKVEIYDNGKGIPAGLAEQMNRGIFPQSHEKNHIGMENAINRIQMYYGDAAKVVIESCEGEWTKIQIRIPADQQ